VTGTRSASVIRNAFDAVLPVNVPPVTVRFERVGMKMPPALVVA